MTTAKHITLIFSNGRTRTFDVQEFEQFGDELEHKTENIIINTLHPEQSFTYELNEKNEISNKEPITEFKYD